MLRGHGTGWCTACAVLMTLGCGDDGGTAPADTDAGSSGDTTAGAMTTAAMSTANPDDDGTTDDGGSTGPGDADTTGQTSEPGDTTAAADDDDTSGDTGPMFDAEFIELDGIVSVEAEHYFEETNNAPTEVYWVTFTDGDPDPVVACETNTPCNGGNAPMCNQYADCDPDAIDPAEASGGSYVEALPDRRRDDTEPGTGELGVVNNQANAATLHYRVYFSQPGRYYVWGHARGQGPAANGIHVGLDDQWPQNDLIDPSSMRMQFPGGWVWTQNRRGGSQHTGVSGNDEVSDRDANIWLEIDAPGVHTIQWGMREDGLEFDKFVMALDPRYVPEGDGPPETTAP